MSAASSSSPDLSRPLSAILVGTWELLSREDYTDSGERRIEPGLGEHPVALLVYDRGGHFAVQFMKRDRSSVVEVDGYDAYFGTYTVDDATGIVTQMLTGALSLESVGQVVTRDMRVVDDALTIQLRTSTADGEAVTRMLKWKRVG